MSLGIKQTARGPPPAPEPGLEQHLQERRSEAVPGVSHMIITSLCRVSSINKDIFSKFFLSMQMGLISKIVCLNYDGLLQKAGCPQELVKVSLEIFLSFLSYTAKHF